MPSESEIFTALDECLAELYRLHAANESGGLTEDQKAEYKRLQEREAELRRVYAGLTVERPLRETVKATKKKAVTPSQPEKVTPEPEPVTRPEWFDAFLLDEWSANPARRSERMYPIKDMETLRAAIGNGHRVNVGPKWPRGADELPLPPCPFEAMVDWHVGKKKVLVEEIVSYPSGLWGNFSVIGTRPEGSPVPVNGSVWLGRFEPIRHAGFQPWELRPVVVMTSGPMATTMLKKGIFPADTLDTVTDQELCDEIDRLRERLSAYWAEKVRRILARGSDAG